MKPSGNAVVHHEGNCSDCNGPVDTRISGACLHNSNMMGVGGSKASVFLLCLPCGNEREKRDTEEWRPGRHHKGDEIRTVDTRVPT